MNQFPMVNNWLIRPCREIWKCTTNLGVCSHRLLHLSSVCVNDFGKNIMKILNVAEKNDAAKSIADIMSNGRFRRREGYSKFNKIYEYEYNIFNQRCVMIMTSVTGHLLNLEFVGSYKKWTSCNPVTLFDAPIDMICLEDHQGIKLTLEREIKNCQHLIIWTDGDREGENIGFEIIEVCKGVKPGVQVHRAKFSEITRQAITRACHHLIQPDHHLSDAVNVRRELDLRIGAAFTRFQTLRLQKVFPEVLSNQLISYGSCQFPTLGFVVERYKQVQAFVPEPFWKLKVTHKKEDGVTEFSWKRGRLFDHTACLVLYQICLENSLASVTDIKSRNKSKWRPQPLDTVVLEKIASRKLRMNAKEAMTVAEKLYTQGFISYPRTETTIFPKELDLVPLVQMQCDDSSWGAFAARVLEDGPNPRQGKKSDNAHPPIHPTKYTRNLQGNEKVVYDFVVRHFLACISKDAEGCETTVEININGEKFATNGLMILARNYLEVYPYERWNAKVISEYNIGETFQPSSLEMCESETSPPDLLTEADLIALMEKHGIGTDATHAEHIETIKSRLYVGLNASGRFVPGELGMGLVEGYDMMGFHMSKPHLRAGLESDLKRISEGLKSPVVVLREQVSSYKQVFIEAVNQAEKIDSALSQYLESTPQQFQQGDLGIESSTVMKCPKCLTSDIVLKKKRDGNGYYLSCMGYPKCTGSLWLPECVEHLSVTSEICSQCKPLSIKKFKFKFKKGSMLPYYIDEVENCLGGCDPHFMTILNVKPIRSSNRNSSSTAFVLSQHSASQSSATFSNNNEFQSKQWNHQNVGLTTSHSIQQNSSGAAFRNLHSNLHINRQSAIRNPLRPVNNQDISTSNGFDFSADDVVCNCGKSASLRTVKKDGPNKGRQFYVCSESSDKQCNFFLWFEQPAVSRTAPPLNNFNAPRASSWPSESPSFSGIITSNSAMPNCKCSSSSKLLTVQKEGPNKGRKFYACAKPMGQGCSFFQWATEDVLPPVFNIPSTSFHNSGPNRKRPSSVGCEQSKRKCGNCNQTGHNRKTCPRRT